MTKTDRLELATFHLTGRTAGSTLTDVAAGDFRPALFSRRADLAALRYDYPVVLADGAGGDGFVRSLKDIVDETLRTIAPTGIKGERLRKHVLGIEREVRVLVAGGARDTLSRLWAKAGEKRLAAADGEARELLKDSIEQARGALGIDGAVIDCDRQTPVALLTHAWAAAQQVKAQRFADEVTSLVLKLSNILKADYIRSAAGRGADALKSAVGTSFHEVFDFDAMSKLLPKAAPGEALPDKRRRRIEAAIEVLNGQRFFAPAAGAGKAKGAKSGGRGKGRPAGAHSFVFTSCAAALDAFRARLPEMLEVIKAMSIAELEINNRYEESKHDGFFSRWNESSLGPDDVASFPSYLVCLEESESAGAEKATLLEILSSDLPIKVLVQSDDILEDLSAAIGLSPTGIKGAQLGRMALGLNSAYVVQAASSHLYRLRERILEGVTRPGPALFTVYSGATPGAEHVPPYLTAAAAVESRAFPTFTYDPAAGADWASRFSIADNPQVDAAWPVHTFTYEDDDLQTTSEEVAFTFADFVACDRRYAGHFGGVRRDDWADAMVPIAEQVKRATAGGPGPNSYVLMVDGDNALHRVIADDKVIHAAQRCAEMWRSLQELGGIDNSHARRLVEQERAAWEEEKEREIAELKGRLEEQAKAPAPAEKAPAAPAAPGAAEAAEAAPAEEEAVEEAPSDEPYIETPRCTTCNECTQINSKMFAYNDNKQAYIADLTAGSYKQLVEAAESCQVSIIHPGKPTNPDEPNLDDLVKRAEPFL